MQRVREVLGGAVGIEPTTPADRRLSGLDLAVLWGDLSVGLLVLAAGALLVPALGLPQAAVAIALGSVLGSLPLALVGVAGAREGLPGMVLFRPVLGVRGSWIPSVLNVIQLIGWTALEFWAMASVASSVSREIFGSSLFPLWLAVSAIGCTALALGGPVRVVRLWLERFGVWVLLGCGAWISVRLIQTGAVSWTAPGRGGWPTFPLAVDLVIAMCVSWLPLVADYDRFAKGRAFSGTFWGFAVGNAWFFLLGAMLAFAGNPGPDPVSVGASVTGLAGGAFVLALLVVAESDEAFANVYSAAVSVRNLIPRVPERLVIVAVAVVATALAATLSMGAYQLFLLLIGSVFVPLFGVFCAAYFLRGRRGTSVGGFEPRALVAWLAGFVVFQLSGPTGPGWWVDALSAMGERLHVSVPLFEGSLGSSVPGFAAAFLAAMALVRRRGAEQQPPAPRSAPPTRS